MVLLASEWIAASALGWACAIGVADALNFGALASAAVGCLAGAAQWLVLRRRIQRAGLWAASGAVAWYTAMQVGIPHGFLSPDPVWTGTVGGALSGLPQWLILRQQVNRSGFWALASLVSSVLGWIAGTAAGGFVYDYLPRNAHLEYAAGGLAGGLVGGVVSVAVLVWLLRHPIETKE